MPWTPGMFAESSRLPSKKAKGRAQQTKAQRRKKTRR